MVKILQLKNFKKSTRKDNASSVSDSQTSELGLVPSHTIDQSVFTKHEKANSLDWNNQELSDLYRVQQILVRAGIQIVTDRGITDENDPWFVFCRSDDDVFVHISRFDGIYLLDSPNIETPLIGHNFKDLIDEFVSRAVKLQESENVVPLHAKGKAFIHPTLMFTALIWSLYLSADELVDVSHAQDLNEPMLYEALGVTSADLENVEDIDILEQFEPSQNDILAENSQLNNDMLAMQGARLTQNSVIVQNAVAGLSAIATTFGFAHYVAFVIEAKSSKTAHTLTQSELTGTSSLDGVVLAKIEEEKNDGDEFTEAHNPQNIHDKTVKESNQILSARLDDIRLDTLIAMRPMLGIDNQTIETPTPGVAMADNVLLHTREAATTSSDLESTVVSENSSALEKTTIKTTIDTPNNGHDLNENQVIETGVTSKIQLSELNYTEKYTSDNIVFDLPVSDLLSDVYADFSQFISNDNLDHPSIINVQFAFADNVADPFLNIEKILEVATLEYNETPLVDFTMSVLANDDATGTPVNNTSDQGAFFDIASSDGTVDSLTFAQNWVYEDKQGNTQEAIVIVTIGSIFDGLNSSQDSVDIAGTSNLGVFSADLFATA